MTLSPQCGHGPPSSALRTVAIGPDSSNRPRASPRWVPVVERWDTWTRSEIMAVRGYETSPARATSVGRSGMTTDDRLEASIGTAPPNGQSSVRITPVVTNRTAASPTGPLAPASSKVGLNTGERACSECGGPLPAESRSERVICSPRCRQLRHDRLRKSRVRPQDRASQLLAVPGPMEVEAAGAVPVALGGPRGWRARGGGVREHAAPRWPAGRAGAAGSVNLSWPTG